MSNNTDSQNQDKAMADEAARQDREKILKHFEKIVRDALKTEHECREELFEKQRELEELKERETSTQEELDALVKDLIGYKIRHKNSLTCLRQFRKRLREVQEMEV